MPLILVRHASAGDRAAWDGDDSHARSTSAAAARPKRSCLGSFLSRRGVLAAPLVIPIGPSGVLLGKVDAGNRLMLPLDDPGEFSRVHIAAQDVLAKRIVVRLAGAGERITVHTRDQQRWDSVRMPDIAVGSQVRPMARTTVSVVYGTTLPAPRPNTLISDRRAGDALSGFGRCAHHPDGPATVDATAAGQLHTVEIELFRAENRYIPRSRRP